MNSGFLYLVAAQFASGLADNALLIVAVARMHEIGAPLWAVPLLKFVFTIAYVVLGPAVGPLADAMPKGRVMLLANGVKISGCLLLAGGVDPLLAFSIAGLGAAAYSPAKYGLVTELLPPQRLVAANGWLEVSTVCAILLGTVLGGVLVSPLLVQAPELRAALEWLDLEAGSPLACAFVAVLLLYALAALLNLGIPNPGRRYRLAPARHAVRDFWRANRVLWRDTLAQVSLAVTTVFWGIGAVLQFLVLRWATEHLGLGFDQAAWLQGVSAFGVIAGAALAGRLVPLRLAPRVLPLGVAMGLLVPAMTALHSFAAAVPLLIAMGGLAGFFAVPMNALLQHRGHVLLSAGRSIAVQNFNENLSVLAMLAGYSALTAAGSSVDALAWAFGLFIAATMGLVLLRQRRLGLSSAHRMEEPA